MAVTVLWSSADCTNLQRRLFTTGRATRPRFPAYTLSPAALVNSASSVAPVPGRTTLLGLPPRLLREAWNWACRQSHGGESQPGTALTAPVPTPPPRWTPQTKRHSVTDATVGHPGRRGVP